HLRSLFTLRANGWRSQICFLSCSDSPSSRTTSNRAICRKLYHRGSLTAGGAGLRCSHSYSLFRFFSTTLPVPSLAESSRATSTQRALQSDFWPLSSRRLTPVERAAW